jgi:hypothetical protein
MSIVEPPSKRFRRDVRREFLDLDPDRFVRIDENTYRTVAKRTQVLRASNLGVRPKLGGGSVGSTGDKARSLVALRYG